MHIVQIACGKTYIEEAEISRKSIEKYITGKYHLITQDVDAKTAAGLKLDILNRIDIKENETVLYLDTDIIVSNHLPPITPIEKVILYGYPNRTQKEHSFAGYINNSPSMNRHIAINTGILFFRNTQRIRTMFQSAYKHYTSTTKINACWEQPYLCNALIHHNLYDTSLTPYVSEHRSPSITPLTTFHHFCGLRSPSRPSLLNSKH